MIYKRYSKYRKVFLGLKVFISLLIFYVFFFCCLPSSSFLFLFSKSSLELRSLAQTKFACSFNIVSHSDFHLKLHKISEQEKRAGNFLTGKTVKQFFGSQLENIRNVFWESNLKKY